STAMAVIKVASWNLQNLFDTTASDIAADLEFTPAQGWDDAALDAKLTALATVIKAMHGGTGPDLLGIVEVETKELLEQLIERTGFTHLKVAHVDSPDIRGIDASLVYSGDLFELAGEPVGHLEEPVKKATSADEPHRANTPTVARYLELKPYLFNCMGALAGASDTGTLTFSEGTNTMNLLDQFMITRGLLFGRQGLQLKR